MINIESEMSRVILFFAIKHKGNWETTYSAIKNKENISLIEMDSIKDKYLKNYISIIDKNYPDNFKKIYMPPLTIFTLGNESLLHDNHLMIHSLWSANGYKLLSEYEFNKGKTYAVMIHNDMIPVINSLTAKGVKIIVTKSDYYENLDLAKLDINENILYFSEIPFEIDQPDINEKQTCERLLLGVSNHATALDIDEKFMDEIYPLFEFEKRYISVKRDQNKKLCENRDYTLQKE